LKTSVSDGALSLLPRRNCRYAPSSRLSSTDIVAKSARVSGTSAMPSMTRSSSDSRSTVAPSYATVPRAGSAAISALSSVDLPAPFGPITVITSPGRARRLRPCSTSARP
jgi:hypothetical protein